MMWDSNGKQASVGFVQKLFPETSSNLKKLDIIYVMTLRDIKKREELFVDYGSLYHIRSAAWSEAIQDLEK